MVQQNAMASSAASSSPEPEHLPKIIIISHGHSPPLVPPAELKYNLRRIPNPPKRIRDALDGRSKRLRDHMREHEEFMSLLDQAHKEIQQAAMASLAVPQKTDGGGITSHEKSEVNDSTEISPSTNKSEAQDTQVSTSDEVDQEADAQFTSKPGSDELGGMQDAIRVSCFCAQGKHRSVAFVEELMQMPWPNGWELSAVHRDVDNDIVGNNKDKRNRAKASWNRRNLAFAEEE